MDKLIIGIDLCDAYTQAAVAGRDETWVIPTVICRKKTDGGWYVGEEAYKYTLMGEGVIDVYKRQVGGVFMVQEKIRELGIGQRAVDVGQHIEDHELIKGDRIR